MPVEVEAIRELAISQWTRTVAFRETIEAMYADGLRVFVDVGARGNLAGYVHDILRGKPIFAIAANLPRRSGLTQLNHLVAALFAQGVPIAAGCPLRAATSATHRLECAGEASSNDRRASSWVSPRCG